MVSLLHSRGNSEEGHWIAKSNKSLLSGSSLHRIFRQVANHVNSFALRFLCYCLKAMHLSDFHNVFTFKRLSAASIQQEL